jgi:tetratricopeptide (TPR) repeat protein
MTLKMKFNRINLIVFLALWLALPMFSFGSQAGTLFENGNALYARAHYKDALAAYRQVLDDGYESAALYFNMGNACYKTDDIPSSILYYEKAHKLAPGDEDINMNLRFVNQKTTDKIEEAPAFFLAVWWRAFILSFSTETLSVLTVVLFLLASGLLVLYFFAQSVIVKKSSFYTSISLYAIGLIFIFMAAMQVSYFNSHRQAIIFSSSTTVKSAPANQAKDLFVLHDGTKVNISGDSNGWIKIKLANGNEGWIKAADAREI